MTADNVSFQPSEFPWTSADPQSRDMLAAPLTPAPRKRLDLEELVDMTAMVDIVFFLLIFFMVTTMQGVYSSIGMPSPNPEKTTLPGRQTVADFEKDSAYIIVRIDRDNMVWLDGAAVPSEQDLHIQLRSARQNSVGPNKMLVLGSPEAKHGTVVMVLDAGNDVGMDEVRLALDEES